MQNELFQQDAVKAVATLKQFAAACLKAGVFTRFEDARSVNEAIDTVEKKISNDGKRKSSTRAGKVGKNNISSNAVVPPIHAVNNVPETKGKKEAEGGKQNRAERRAAERKPAGSGSVKDKKTEHELKPERHQAELPINKNE